MKTLILLLFPLLLLQSSFAFDYENLSRKERNHLQLTQEETDILDNGELSTPRYIVGGVLSYYPGLGIGHAVQGRWKTKGWIFTAGEIGSAMMFSAGSVECTFSFGSNCSTLIMGYFAFLGFKVWEVADAWYGGYQQMKKYPMLSEELEEELKRLEDAKPKSISWYMAPAVQQTIKGNISGLSVGFRF